MARRITPVIMGEIAKSVIGNRTVYVDDNGRSLFFEDEGKCELFAALAERMGGWERYEYELVPLPVALEGKPALAVWMWTREEWGYGRIADELDVSRATARQYVSDFRREVR